MCGFDLSYAWREALENTRGSVPNSLLLELSFQKEEDGVGQVLERLAASFSIPRFRIWFSILLELYGKGAGLVEPMNGILRALRKEQEREVEIFIRGLPLRVNVALLIFFLPPALGLVFMPLLLQFVSGL